MFKLLLAFSILAFSKSAFAAATLSATCVNNGTVEVTRENADGTRWTNTFQIPSCDKFSLVEATDSVSTEAQYMIASENHAAVFSVDDAGLQMKFNLPTKVLGNQVSLVAVTRSFYSPSKTLSVTYIEHLITTTRGWRMPGSGIVSNLSKECAREVGQLMRQIPPSPGEADFRTAVEDYLLANEAKCQGTGYEHISI